MGPRRAGSGPSNAPRGAQQARPAKTADRRTGAGVGLASQGGRSIGCADFRPQKSGGRPQRPAIRPPARHPAAARDAGPPRPPGVGNGAERDRCSRTADEGPQCGGSWRRRARPTPGWPCGGSSTRMRPSREPTGRGGPWCQ